MSSLYWDDEDDDDDSDEPDYDDPYGDDDEDPYGEDEEDQDEDPFGDEGEAEGEGELEDEEESKEEEKVEAKEKDDDKSGKGKKLNMKKIKAEAKALGFVELPVSPVCPGCKERTIFGDKYVPTGIKIITTIVKGCIGIFNADKDLNVVRFVCLNKRCKHYYPRTGDKFKINVTKGGKNNLVVEKHYFHVNK